MGVEIDLTYNGDLHCTAVHGPSGVVLQTDAPVDNGGRGESFSPTDLVATALGACVSTIMGIMAKRQNLDISGMTVHVVKDMVADPVRRIGTLTVTVTLPAGSKLTDHDYSLLQKAANHCPVAQTLHPDTKVTIEYKRA